MKEKTNTKSLLARWKERNKTNALSSGLAKAPVDARIPVSSGQRRLWFLQQLYPENPVYNQSEKYSFFGNIDPAILKQSLQNVFKTNTILQAAFQFDDDQVFQTIDTPSEISIQEHDLSGIPLSQKEDKKQELLMLNAGQHFELDQPPLLRILLLKIDETEWVLLVTMHHIITDKWSMGLFRDLLAENYRELSIDSNYKVVQPLIQFSDYAYWEQNQILDEDQLVYWREKLSGNIPQLQLPTDRERHSEISFVGGRNIKQLDSQLSSKLLDLATQLETTPYVLLLSAYYLLLYRYSGQRDIIIGSPVSNRQKKVLENVIGFFDETLILRTKFDPFGSFLELVDKVKTTTLEAFSNKEIPFDVLVKELKPERTSVDNPFFRTMFIYHAVPTSPFFATDIELSLTYLNSGVSKFDLTLYIENDEGILTAAFEYATDLFKESTIIQLQEHFRILLEGIVAKPSLELKNYRMRTAFERKLFNRNAAFELDPFESFEGIHEVFEFEATQNPSANAVMFMDAALTYDELNKRANLVAAGLMEYTEGNNEIIGLCADRSLEMIIGLLGILKAGCAYVPIDPDYPKARIEFMVSDADISIVLTTPYSGTRFQKSAAEIIEVNDILQTATPNSIKWPTASKENLAYIIYTSGSTGNPKGVPISHGNILSSTAGRLVFYPENPKVFLLMSSISFDSSKAGIYWTLCTGGCLVIAEKRIEQEPKKLLQTIKENKVTHSLMLPSLYKILLDFGEASDFGKMTAMIVAGEACAPAVVHSHFETLPGVALYNEYGPTEGTVWCTAYPIKKEDADSPIPIGKAVANTRIWVLNTDHIPVPIGSSGELYISGPGLTTGYLNRPDLTQKMFNAHPGSPLDQVLYATGDLVRYRKDGNLEFLGRVDEQVKIRGHRVELGAVEKIIMELATIEQVKVIWDQQTKTLKAAVISDNTLDFQKIKTHLSNEIPAYMIPVQWAQLAAFPTLPNGKIDSKLLQHELRANNNISSDNNLKPENEIQDTLQAVWETVLNKSPIGINENFFEIGGDSISSIQIIAKARAEGLAIEPNQLFEYQTIKELSLFVTKKAPQNDADTYWEGNVALSPIQHWFFNTYKTAPHFWNQIVTIRSSTRLIYKDLKNVIEALVKHHDGLRLAFTQKENDWNARVIPMDEIKCCFKFEFSADLAQKDLDSNIEILLRDHQESCNLHKGSLFRLLYVDRGEHREPNVFLIAHHLLVDIVSWNSIFDDIKSGLEAISKGQNISFKAKTDSLLSYVDFIESTANKHAIQTEIPFWKKQLEVDYELPFEHEQTLPYLEQNVAVHRLELSDKNYLREMNNAHAAYNTNTEDLLLSALFLSFQNIFEINTLGIYLERHGRTINDPTYDFTNTIGWFTSFFPMSLTYNDPIDPGSVVKSIKEQLREIPSDGIGYGILTYILENNAFNRPSKNLPQIVFNYLGQISGLNTEPGASFEFLGHSHRNPLSERMYALEINAFSIDQSLCINFNYDTKYYKQDTITHLTEVFTENLNTIILHCLNSGSIGFTPSDFPEAQMSQDDLDNLLEQLG